ncbi:hypothetical protein CyaNS01_02861 [Cyanobium sp. NS01]|nr:hypothetical protein CyaNS01_02861 [Cyanobium sp. NS01]
MSSRTSSSHCFAEAFGYRVEKKLSTTALSQQQPLADVLQTLSCFPGRSR